MTSLSPAILQEALLLVAERLADGDAPAETLVVCGGSALLALGLVDRTTKDVDVLAGVDGVSGLTDPRPLSPTLRRAVEEVGAQMDLPPGWLNTGPAGQVLMGLPEGFLARLVRRDYGAKLTIYYPDRFDLIHLKFFAVIDQGPGRHVSDLRKLTPADAEMLAAARWVLTQDAGAGFSGQVVEALNQLGFTDVARQL
jgi:hypothetical protein